LSCATGNRLYRLSLVDGVLLSVAGSSDATTFEGPASGVRFSEPNGLALAPRELCRDGDAFALLLCDMDADRLCLIHVPLCGERSR
jgi:hypothetical protein